MTVESSETETTEQLCLSVIRGLAMDAPNAAKSGHQGTAMALAPLAHVLYTRVMRFDPADPQWPDRDRFVLSPGHASILQYSMLYLSGFGLTLDDLKQFRQWDSATPGHPEAGHTAGVEVTTGPLGQGIANAVGMALAERYHRGRFGEQFSNHRTWAIVSDGDLMEGISHEAASLAGHQQLDRLIAIYDDNHITIDGDTNIAVTDNAAERFRSYGWNVIEAGELGDDLDAIEAVLRQAAAHTGAPTLVILRTHIGTPSPTFTDTPDAHGLPFNAETIAEAKDVMGIPNEPFWVPDEVVEFYRASMARGAEARTAWEAQVAADPAKAEWDAMWAAQLGDAFVATLPTWAPGDSIATRQASGKAVVALADALSSVLVGSADLSGNTGTKLSGAEPASAATPAGRQIHYGIREHAMAAAMVGMALHGGVLPIAGTFLAFSDYMRPAVRLAALSSAKTVFVWSHDSVGVGEDGPTHQPIEQVMSLRLIPGLAVYRPADGPETVACWQDALALDGPSAMILSRQNLPVLAGTDVAVADGVARGAYTLIEADGDTPDAIIVATGSEVSLAVEAASALAASGTRCRVVSMPCWERFAEQSADYRAAVLPRSVPTVSVEAGVTTGWAAFADASVGIDRFGASAPGAAVMDKLGVNVPAITAAVTELLASPAR